MKACFEKLIFLILVLLNLAAMDQQDVDPVKKSRSFYEAFKAIDDQTLYEGNRVNEQSKDNLKNILRTRNLHNPTINNSTENIDLLVNNICGTLYARKTFIKLNEEQFVQVVNGCQDFFKTRFGFSLIEGWMQYRFDEAITPYYVGKFHSYKKMFEGMIEKFSDQKYSGVTNAIDSVFQDAMENIQKDRWDYYFNCELWLHSAIDRVSTDATTVQTLAEAKVEAKSDELNDTTTTINNTATTYAHNSRLPGMHDIIKKSFIGLKAQREEALGYTKEDGTSVQGIGLPIFKSNEDEILNEGQSDILNEKEKDLNLDFKKTIESGIFFKYFILPMSKTLYNLGIMSALFRHKNGTITMLEFDQLASQEMCETSELIEPLSSVSSEKDIFHDRRVMFRPTQRFFTLAIFTAGLSITALYASKNKGARDAVLKSLLEFFKSFK